MNSGDLTRRRGTPSTDSPVILVPPVASIQQGGIPKGILKGDGNPAMPQVTGSTKEHPAVGVIRETVGFDATLLVNEVVLAAVGE